MCQFCSWIEYKDDIYFLTSAELNTKEGRELRKYLGDQFYEDIKGHGAIDRYWGLNGKGRHKECEDFSKPSNFPKLIQEAIKAGKFRGIGVSEGLLTAPAGKAYQEAKATAWKAYQEAKANTFWDLFSDPNNRAEAWR